MMALCVRGGQPVVASPPPSAFGRDSVAGVDWLGRRTGFLKGLSCAARMPERSGTLNGGISSLASLSRLEGYLELEGNTRRRREAKQVLGGVVALNGGNARVRVLLPVCPRVAFEPLGHHIGDVEGQRPAAPGRDVPVGDVDADVHRTVELAVGASGKLGIARMRAGRGVVVELGPSPEASNLPGAAERPVVAVLRDGDLVHVHLAVAAVGARGLSAGDQDDRTGHGYGQKTANQRAWSHTISLRSTPLDRKHGNAPLKLPDRAQESEGLDELGGTRI